MKREPAYIYATVARQPPPQPPALSGGPSYECMSREELARLCGGPKRKRKCRKSRP